MCISRITGYRMQLCGTPVVHSVVADMKQQSSRTVIFVTNRTLAIAARDKNPTCSVWSSMSCRVVSNAPALSGLMSMIPCSYELPHKIPSRRILSLSQYSIRVQKPDWKWARSLAAAKLGTTRRVSTVPIPLIRLRGLSISRNFLFWFLRFGLF